MVLKKKPVKVVEPKVEKVEKPSLDIQPIIEKLSMMITELNTLNSTLPKTFEALQTGIKTLNEKPTASKPVEEFKNINDKLFDINQLLASFVNSQAQLGLMLNKEEEVKSDPLLDTIAKNIELTNTLLKAKKANKWVFDVLKDNNGIYKVIATSNG